MSPHDRSCVARAFDAATTSASFGALVGCAQTAFSPDAPAVVRARAFPAFASAARATARSATVFGALGATYASVECVARDVRKKEDFVNGALGGVACGFVVALIRGNARAGLGAAATFAIASSLYEITGRTIGPTEGFDDGATPARIIVPYRE